MITKVNVVKQLTAEGASKEIRSRNIPAVVGDEKSAVLLPSKTPLEAAECQLKLYVAWRHNTPHPTCAILILVLGYLIKSRACQHYCKTKRHSTCTFEVALYYPIGADGRCIDDMINVR